MLEEAMRIAGVTEDVMKTTEQINTLSDEELYQYYLECENRDDGEAEQELIEKMPRFESYVRDRDYTVCRRTQDWYRDE